MDLAEAEKKEIVIPLDEIQPPSRGIQGLKVGFLKNPEGWCCCIPQTIILLQRYGYDIYIENNICDNWKNDDFEKYLCNIVERKEVISICDVIVSFHFEQDDFLVFHNDQIIITEKKLITNNIKQQLLGCSVEVITLDTIPFNKQYMPYSSTYAINCGKGKAAALIAIDELGIISSCYKYQALITNPENVSLLTCGETLRHFNVSLSLTSSNPDIIITDKILGNTTYKKGTIIIPITNGTFQFDSSKYSIMPINNQLLINKHISTSISFAVLNFLKYCRFNGFFNKEDELSQYYTFIYNHQYVSTIQELLPEENVSSQQPHDTEGKDLKKTAFVLFVQRYCNKSYIALFGVVVFLILLTIWGSLQSSVENSIKDPILICILSCVVGAFMASKISVSVHIPTILLLLSISCSIGFTCLNVITELNNIVGTSYRQYGLSIVDLLSLFMISTLLTSSVILVLKMMRLYRVN